MMPKVHKPKENSTANRQTAIRTNLKALTAVRRRAVSVSGEWEKWFMNLKTSSQATHFLAICLLLCSTVRALMVPKPNPPGLRIELFFRNSDDLRERVKFLASEGVKSFNIVNKSNRDELIHWRNIIREEIPDSDICVHYSLKYNKCRKKDGAFILLSDFLDEMSLAEELNITNNTKRGGKDEVLLISGSGPKGKLNTVNALEKIYSREKEKLSFLNSNHCATRIAVAFNPFFPSHEDYEAEQQRLVKKIRTGQVSKVYFQFGTDLDRLRAALDWLITTIKKEKSEISICGSIFLPTKKLIAQQKFRPWNGVFLSEEFLSSDKDARGIVQFMIQIYNQYGCEIVIEAPGVRRENDLNIVKSLLPEKFEPNIGLEDQKMRGSDKKKPRISESIANLNAKRIKTNTLIPPHHIPKEAIEKPAIILFGSYDVRVHDNIALQLASLHSNVIPVFIWNRSEQQKWGTIGATEVVLKDALKSLNFKFESNNLRLIVRTAEDSVEELCKLCEQSGASTVYMNKENIPESRDREKQFKDKLKEKGVFFVECQSSLLYDPTILSLKPGFNGGHWGTLMPFFKGCKKQLGEPRRPLPRYQTVSMLEAMKGPDSWPKSIPVSNLAMGRMRRENAWDMPIKERFPMSEDDALKNLDTFFKNGFHRYEKERSRADIEWSTSKLSVHLRIGTLSPNELFYRVEDSDMDYEDKKTFSRRLFWRDLAYFQLLKFPGMRDCSIRTHYDDTEWVDGKEEKRRFEAWKKGNTGYPLVDAGMRELYETGWMTQSVRMIVASFLTEYLRVNWVKGCEWFHYTLVDADSAINAMMWQNAGRSGIDQWNFIMSPVAATQDATGSFTRRWVPELALLPKSFLHKPWDAPDEVLKQAGITLGETYPLRIVVDLKAENEISDNNVLAMRRRHPEFNNDRGYDTISVDGCNTVVFTKKKFRIDEEGNVVTKNSTNLFKPGNDGSKRRYRGRSRKLPA